MNAAFPRAGIKPALRIKKCNAGNGRTHGFAAERRCELFLFRRAEFIPARGNTTPDFSCIRRVGTLCLRGGEASGEQNRHLCFFAMFSRVGK